MPHSALQTVFNRQLFADLKRRANPSKELLFNLSVLQSRCSADLRLDSQTTRHSRHALQRTWARYIDCAARAGFLSSDRDVVSRLRTLEGDNFRSAMAECAAAWLFLAELRLPVEAKPAGRDRRILDLGCSIGGQRVGVEVKAPYRIRQQPVWAGDDADLIQNALNAANTQFDNAGPNILLLVPTFAPHLYHQRLTIIKALLGTPALVLTIDKDTGTAVGEPRSDFVLDGKFTKPIRNGIAPGFTRVSAVITLESAPDSRIHTVFGKPFWISCSIQHNVLVAHNPFAKFPIAPSVFGRWPQLVRQGDEMRWTDDGAEW